MMQKQEKDGDKDEDEDGDGIVTERKGRKSMSGSLLQSARRTMHCLS